MFVTAAFSTVQQQGYFKICLGPPYQCGVVIHQCSGVRAFS